MGLALVAGAGSARAEEGGKGGEKMPLPFAQRPLTLPKMTLAPEVGLEVSHVSIGAFSLGNAVGMEIGAHFGILDDLEVGAVVLPLEFSPDFAYGNPRIEATFRFLKGTVEIGARLRTTFGLHKGSTGVILEPGLPILIHVGEAARIDTGVFLPMAFSTSPGDLPTSSSTTIGLNIPFQFIYDVIPELHLGANTGLGIYDFGEAGNTIYIPLGFVAGYAIGNEKGPLVDIDPYFRFPYFALPGAGSGQDKIYTGIWQTGVAATVYLYL
ncbi:MAG: hypothetical protein ABJE95_33955 [Byssovorax sp.]